MRNFRDLRVWSRSHELALAVYKITRRFPRDELYGLTSQIRRAAASIGANIAEGCGRRSDPEMARFLRIAMGSATELECHLLLALDLGFMEQPDFSLLEEKLVEVKAMIGLLLQRVEAGCERLRTSEVTRSKGSKIRPFPPRA
jgi:four helix bundle protein